MLYYFPREREMLSKATVCAILYLSLWHLYEHGEKKYRASSSGFLLVWQALMDQLDGSGYLKLPLRLHAKVISLLEIDHCVSMLSPFVLLT